ncbi:FbpB family small basic protein [Salibacterium aidingense]|nr:FbpB family small basic protein [Salibacterium aidingense]
MYKQKKQSLKNLIEANKQEIKNTPALLDKLEEKWENKRKMS